MAISKSKHQMTPFTCDMSTLTHIEREEHIATIKAVFGAVQEIRELTDGYAFRLANEKDTFMRLARFVANERLCCPFFGFRIEIEPEDGPIWLSLTGGEGIKPFIQAEIREHLPDDVAPESLFR